MNKKSNNGNNDRVMKLKKNMKGWHFLKYLASTCYPEEIISILKKKR
jgi:hypothetical protein